MNRALILIDIQNDYFEGGANPLVGSREASGCARALLERFRARALPVVHVRHLSTRPDATVRAARDFGFTCTLIGDACATRPLEIGGRSVSAAEVQTAFLAALSYFYADVTTTDNYLNA